MTTARRDIVDLDVTRYYHTISKCVRGAHLCGGKYEYRKAWLEERLEFLASQFAISVASFVFMDNHLHVLIRLDPEDAEKWSDDEIARRWLTLCTPKGLDLGDEKKLKAQVREYTDDPEKIAEYRQRLANMGWFMKMLKEPLARLANKDDDVKGVFWDGRYKSIAVIEDEALLATCAYIDLNPIAAGIAAQPETSRYTSVRQRVRHFRQKNQLKQLKSALQGSVTASRKIGNAEQDHWLIPFEDRRPHTNCRPSSPREGMLEQFTLGHYLLLVEYTGRLFREGKARIKENLPPIFERLETSLESWAGRVRTMLSLKKLRGHRFASSELKP